MATATAKPPPSIVTVGRNLPGRFAIYGPEKVGKTSMGAYMPKPIFMQIIGETGLETLMAAGQLPPTPHFPGEVTSWDELLANLRLLVKENHGHKTLVFDALDGLQKLCFDHVRDMQFGGDEGKFMAYHKGYDVAPNTWKELLNALDYVRETKDMAIVLLGHSRILKRKNPSGEDWTYYGPAIHEKLWEVTARWVDAIFFLNFETVVDDGKGHGGKSRMLYVENDATYIAGNRYGLSEDINAGDSPEQACENLMTALRTSKTTKTKE